MGSGGQVSAGGPIEKRDKLYSNVWCNAQHLLQGGALTFQAGGVELDEELGAAGRLHDGLDALKLDVGLFRRLGQTCRGGAT